MILKEFSDFLKNNEQKPSVSLLYAWLKMKIESPQKKQCGQNFAKKKYTLQKTKRETFCLSGNPRQEGI